MPAPRVAVVVRTKDRPLLLARALADLGRQTFTGWEAVVVNDGGDPRAVDACVRKAKLGDRVVVVHNDSPTGRAAAFNLGIASSRGDYVVGHDDDDTWHPEFLQRTVDYLDEHPGAVAVATATEVVVERIDGKDIIEDHRWRFGPPGDVVTVFDLLLSNRIVPIGLLMRRSAIAEIGGFDTSLAVVEDWEFNLRLALLGEIAYLGDEVLAYWHQRPGTTGVLSNSVVDGQDLHFSYDRLVRDRILRAELAEGGLGTLLYLAKALDERSAAVERHIDRVVADRIGAAVSELRDAQRGLLADIDRIVHGHVQYHSPVATVRRALRRLLPGRRR